jgi:hypothetical protein
LSLAERVTGTCKLCNALPDEKDAAGPVITSGRSQEPLSEQEIDKSGTPAAHDIATMTGWL